MLPPYSRTRFGFEITRTLVVRSLRGSFGTCSSQSRAFPRFQALGIPDLGLGPVWLGRLDVLSLFGVPGLPTPGLPTYSLYGKGKDSIFRPAQVYLAGFGSGHQATP